MRLLILIIGLLSLAGCASPSTDDWLLQLKDEDVVKRRQAIRELSARPKEAQRIVPALRDALRYDNVFVRRDAAIALAKFGPDAREAVPALTLALRDKDQSVRNAASSALKKIDPQAPK